MTIPLIDLFSGPGGLGEGFASLDEGRAFRIVVSAEADPFARSTLCLRSYFRRLREHGGQLNRYYAFCNGEAAEPFDRATAFAWRDAEAEARQITLGTPEGNKELDTRIDMRLGTGVESVLIGGPPCQAFSLVGRSRNLGNASYRPEDDHRHFLYKEYLRVIRRYRPAVFVMENVKGILSSTVAGRRVFQDILLDLSDPEAALTGRPGTNGACYRIHSLVEPTVFRRGMDVDDLDPRDFVVRAEEHGIPQARHRVILLGVREDIDRMPEPMQREEQWVTVSDAISDLPQLRSHISRSTDSGDQWLRTVRGHLLSLAADAAHRRLHRMSEALGKAAQDLGPNLFHRVRSSIGATNGISDIADELRDDNLIHPLNHEARGHMSGDLRRYAFAAVFAELQGVSPKGHEDFNLDGLAPNHANWSSGKFADRFRVQVWNRPATTVTSHISKDGHYFIHPDPLQCRSLTVREAARLQTFPDNYLFMGNRTQQFHQVGNAVPPLLARKIAAIAKKLLE